MSTRQVGIEALNVYGGSAGLDVRMLADYRELDTSRFNNLMMHEKTVALISEDPVTFAVNAARPLIEAMSQEERDSIELLITCTESGIDFGKSISTYVHDHLGLSRTCRVFELKQACYSATAGLQMAAGFVLSQASPGAKALVVAVDLCRFMMLGEEGARKQDWAFSEPSGGAGAVAMLVSDRPDVFRLDVGANGYHTYEVMDTCRPQPDSEAGDPDVSLMSYLDCAEHSFRAYRQRVSEADYRHSFQYLAFHTPFGGMVKGAHRAMMRKLAGCPPAEAEADFQRRVAPGLAYCQRVGNIMGGTLFLALAGIIANGDFASPKRIGCYAYGSGCCSEFFSGVATAAGQAKLRAQGIEAQLNGRYRLSIAEYESVLADSRLVRFGTRDVEVQCALGERIRKNGPPRLYLKAIRNFHREYEFA